MKILYPHSNVFVWGLHYKLGRVRRNLQQLAEAKLLCNSVDTLAKIGYQHNFGAAHDETLLTLAADPLAEMLKESSSLRALVFHHTYAENGVMPWASEETNPASRAQYFPAALMREVGLDHVTFLSAFAGGCSGIFPLLLTAAGLLGDSTEESVLCLTADIRPQGTAYDALREQSLFTDASGGFVVGRSPAGYQVLGISYYSTARTVVLLVEAVKRTVEMIRELAKDLQIELSNHDVVIHYPNVFPKVWEMVTGYLKLSREAHVLDGLADRAHCLSADSIITLKKLHLGRADRLHIVVNMGAGIHVGVCFLKEMHTAKAV